MEQKIQLRWWLSLLIAPLLLVGACRPSTHFARSHSPSIPMRLIQHTMGETNVPLHPKRVVALDLCALDHAIALGIQPVGAPQSSLDDAHYLKGKVAGITDIGSPPDVEKILALKPDVILGITYGNREIYPLTSQIAPTILIEGDGGKEWKTALTLFGDVLGRPDAARLALADYRDRIHQFKTQLRRKSTLKQDITVSLINLYQGSYGLYPENTFAGLILKDAGLLRPPSQAFPSTEQVIISQERILDMDADVLFVPDTDTFEISNLLSQLQTDPLWSKLTVVQRNQVHKVGIYWFHCSSLAASAVVEDLFKYVISP